MFVPVPTLLVESAAAQIRELLAASKLPYQDLQFADSTFVGEYLNGKLIAVAGLEWYGDEALLRSVAVVPAHRKTGQARHLVDTLVEKARARGVKKIVLLTETAQDYFRKRGFVEVSRSALGAMVQGSSEFTTACPSSAVCMALELV